MRLFLKRTGVIIIIFIAVSCMISAGSLWALRQSSFYKPSFLVNNIEENQFDYIVLGASTGLTTLNTKVIDSSLGAKGLNLAMDDTGLSSQYLMLQHFLAEGKQTRYCILAASTSSFDMRNMDVSDNDYRFLPYVNKSYVSDYFGHFGTVRSKLMEYSKYTPVLGVGYYNAELFYPALLGLLKPDIRNRFDDRGNYSYPKKERQAKPIVRFKKQSVEFSNGYIQKIKALCASNNITLIYYFSPMEGIEIVPEISLYDVINHSNLLTNTSYFYDAIHVNTKGRKIASERFADELEDLLK